MTEIQISKTELVNLLKRTQRMATINGKQIPQVQGTILYIVNDEIQTFNIVRDGTSSIATFCADITSGQGEEIPVANIGLLLGAVSKHNGELTLSYSDNKLLIKSAHKQTTLRSSADAQAYSHTKKTIKEWCGDSAARYSHTIVKNFGKYTLKNGEIIDPSFEITLDSKTIASAMDCGSMNGQKVESYRFEHKDGAFCLTVGDNMKGKTHSILHASSEGELVCEVGGGLENILRTVDGAVNLTFFDLTPYGGGMSLALAFNGGCIFQREAVKNASD